jgi:hypothetical protein
MAKIISMKERISKIKPNPMFKSDPPNPVSGCPICGRTLDELKPDRKPGEYLVGFFDGAVIARSARGPGPPPDDKSQEIYDQFFGNCETLDDWEEAKKQVIEEYGEEDAKIILGRQEAYAYTDNFYQCWDCMALDEYEFAEKTGCDLDKIYSWKPRRKVEEGSYTRE